MKIGVDINSTPRIQSGVVPLVENHTKVMLIRNSANTEWGFPKGGVEANMTKRDSAAKEAWEEAGVVGDVPSYRLGSYQYKKGGRPQIVHMFAMNVTEILKTWPEKARRTRKLVTVQEAEHLLPPHGRKLLKMAILSLQ